VLKLTHAHAHYVHSQCIVLEADTKAADTVALTPRPLIRNASLLKCIMMIPRGHLYSAREPLEKTHYTACCWAAAVRRGRSWSIENNILFRSIDDLNTSYNLLFSLQIFFSSCIFEITTVILLQSFCTTMSNTTVQITELLHRIIYYDKIRLYVIGFYRHF